MISVPSRLLNESFVQVYFQGNHLVLLSKELEEGIENRSSYVSRHAVSIVLKGHQRISGLEGQQLNLQAGDIGLVKKGLYSITDMLTKDNTFSSFHLFFDDNILEMVLRNQRSPLPGKAPSPIMTKVSTFAYFPSYLASLQQLHRQFPNPASELFHLKAQEFFAVLLQSEAGDQVRAFLHSLRTPAPKQLGAFMQAHFDKPLTIQDYAYLTGRSLSTFQRVFKARFGESPRKWIIKKRLEKAKTLLHEKSILVSDVALDVGYENVSHFIRGFKKEFGKTPKEYQLMVTHS